MLSPCVNCGACCAFFRVSFYWAETTSGFGRVPADMTMKVNDFLSCMSGTSGKPVRCDALQGEIGQTVCCSIYEDRSSTCREFEYSWENGRHQPDCDKARAAHGLPPLVLPFFPLVDEKPVVA